MNKQNFIAAVGICLGLLGIFLWFFAKNKTLVKPTEGVSSTMLSKKPSPLVREYPQISLKTTSRDEAIKISVDRLSKDPQADWKIPISFYGKVVDESEKPVASATVHFGWTTIGASGGYAKADALSDNEGLFSLTGQHGKSLEVRVEKEGYYIANGNHENLFFEYANPDPSGSVYYEPDPKNPFVFHLRKKGSTETALLHWHRFTELDAKGQIDLDLKTGKNAREGDPYISFRVFKNSGKIDAFTWSARVSVIGGALRLETDQFPFLAPENGYQSSVDIDLNTPLPPSYNGNHGAAFYVQTPKGYGRYEIRTWLGDSSINAEGVFNPTPDSRNLEYDPENTAPAAQ